MALAIGFRGVLYDDVEPLYCATTDGWLLQRVSNQWLEAQALSDAMASEGYVPTTDFVTAGVGGVEIGIASEGWQDHNEAHEFWEGEAGGRDWGDPGVVFPTGAGGGGNGGGQSIKGPFNAFGTDFWVNTNGCKVGFDVDSDPEADVWLTGQQVCESDIADNVKMAIDAQLKACDCAGLPCMTATGKVQKAYQQSTIQAKGDGDE